MNKNNKKTIWLGLIISLFFFLIFIFTKDVGQNISNRQDLSKQVLPVSTEIVQAFLEINGEKLETKIKEKESVYGFMEQLRREGKINFKDETYAGMGKLIKEINGLENSGEKNWIYYVNGKKAEIGVSNYKINKGDIISWKYEKSY